MILKGETEVGGGNPPIPRVLYETLMPEMLLMHFPLSQHTYTHSEGPLLLPSSNTSASRSSPPSLLWQRNRWDTSCCSCLLKGACTTWIMIVCRSVWSLSSRFYGWVWRRTCTCTSHYIVGHKCH